MGSKYFYKFAAVVLIWCVLYFYIGSNWLAFLFSIISIITFIPMFFYRMIGIDFGFAAMILLSSVQSFEVGIIVGKIPNLIGRLLTFNFEMEFLYETFGYVIIAFVASLSPLNLITTIGTMLILIYTLGYLAFHWFLDILTPVEWSFAITNAIFNVVVISQLVPILARMGYG